MAIKNMTYLPDSINHKGEEMTYIIGMDNDDIKEICDDRDFPYKEVHVLSKNLRDRLDLHHKPYKPTEWIFVGYAAKICIESIRDNRRN